MSFTSPFKKSYSKHQVEASSSSLKMAEQLTDSNILQSRKTYGRKKDDRTSSISSESSGSFSVATSEDLKNNGMLSFTDFNEESYSEEHFDFIASITNSYSENSTFQNGNVVDSEFSLYTEKDMEYLYSEKIEQSSSSIPDILNSCSNYQRTRKNQKNRLSNQQYGSEEIYESKLYSDNFKSLTDTNESKSASNVLNPNPVHAKQNSPTSEENKLKHKKNNGIQSNDGFVNDFSNKQNFFEAGRSFGRETISQTPLKNTKLLPILDLVNRFTASRNQDKTKSKQTNKRKRVKEESGSVPAKKIAPVVKVDASSKISSIENKIPNSISFKKFSKNTVLKSDIGSMVSYQDTFKEDGVKTPPKSTQKNSRSVKSERSPSKSVHKKKCVSVSNVESVDMINNTSKITQFKKSDFKTPSKAVGKKPSRFVNDTERNVDLLFSVNGIVRTLPETVQRENARSVNSMEKSIKRLKKYVSKNSPVKNYVPAKVKVPSSIADLPLVGNEVDEDGNNSHHIITSYLDDRQIETSSFLPAQDSAVQNQNPDNLNGPLNMPMIIAPMPPTFEEGAAEVIPLGIWKTVPAITYTNAVSYENLSVPGPSILSNGHFNVNGSDSNLHNLETNENIYFITDDTTTTIINESHVGDDKQKSVFRPRTHLVDGTDFGHFLTDNIKNIEDNCLLHCKEQSSQTFLRNPALLNITVEDFYNNHGLTDILLDYLSGVDMGNPLAIYNTNEGYDFPENFETENLLRVVKDFVHTTISCMVPANTNNSFTISYSRIMQFAMTKMSSREMVMMSLVFKITDHMLRLKDVLARLSLVALFVIFDEYRNKKCI